MAEHGNNGVNAEHLRALIERVEKIEQNISDEQEARKEIYSEAKSAGYDPKIMKRIVAIRKQDKAKREADNAMIQLYADALQLDLFI